MIACMGGWCAKREKCPHHVEAERIEPVERLCMPGEDGVRVIEASPFRSIRVHLLERQEDAA